MPKLHYISMARFPTEKAHGLQIAQNCEAFADTGYDVQLWVSNRQNIPEMQQITDIHQHYGIKQNFEIKRVPSLDLYPFANRSPKLEYIAFYIHIITYSLMLLLRLINNRADIYYSRDEYALLALSLLIPKHKLAFEVHQFAPTKRGAWIQSQVTKRVGHIIAITPKLREDFIAHRGASSEQIIVAHDGIRAARFENLPDKATARESIDWSQDAFVVGYMGRLHTMGMDKGVGLLAEAIAQMDDVALGLVGGPDEMAAQLEQKWLASGASAEDFLYSGTVSPDDIPTYLAAFDICAMPFPWTEHYAYYMSPLKLFEYMASGNVILATDLPSVTDVVTHLETAYVVEASNIEALKEGIRTLQDDAHLREAIAQKARETVIAEYTWLARAQHIKSHIER